MRHLRESIHKALRIFLSAIFQILPGAEGLCNTPEQSELTNGTAYGTGAELLEQMRSFFNTFFPKAGGGKQPLPALFFPVLIPLSHGCGYRTDFAEPVRCCNSIKESSTMMHVLCDGAVLFCSE